MYVFHCLGLLQSCELYTLGLLHNAKEEIRALVKVAHLKGHFLTEEP